MNQNPSYVLFLDLWGTLAKLENAQEVESCQRHFFGTLDSLKSSTPEVTVTVSGDCASAYATELLPLLKFSTLLFQKMNLAGESFQLRPLRGAIAFGSFYLGEGKAVGIGNLEAARIEKTGQKGMRLFLTKDLATQAQEAGYLVRESNARGLEHAEVNWMKTPKFENDLGPFLNQRRGELTTADWLTGSSKELFERNDSYFQQLGSSLTDLVRWS